MKSQGLSHLIRSVLLEDHSVADRHLEVASRPTLVKEASERGVRILWASRLGERAMHKAWKGDDSGRTQAASLLTRLVSCRSNSAPCHSGNFLLGTRA